MIDTISQPSALESLEKYHRHLAESVHIAWEEWGSHDAGRMPAPFGRTIACNMQEVVRRELTVRLGDDENVAFIRTRDQRFAVLLKEARIILFIKKLDRNFHVSNYPTRAARRFAAQQSVMELPDYVRLVVGYRLDPFRTQLTGVFIAMPLGLRRTHWYYELSRSGAIVEPLRTQLSLPSGKDLVKARPMQKPKKQ